MLPSVLAKAASIMSAEGSRPRPAHPAFDKRARHDDCPMKQSSGDVALDVLIAACLAGVKLWLGIGSVARQNVCCNFDNFGRIFAAEILGRPIGEFL